MNWFEFVIIITLTTTVITKKYIPSSDESIENLLYFKDCQHTTKEPQPLPLRAEMPVLREPECRFPRMCCALTCDNECNNQQSFASRQANAHQSILPHSSRPQQPQLSIQPQKGKKKKNLHSKIQPPIGGRRDFGFTKEKIKGLISHDGDIRKILKDLVRVTMQKVDLQDMLTSRRNGNVKSEISKNIEDDLE